MAKNNTLVAIRCITYNHARYIKQCLDGFVMQKTSFKFVAIVHDDCSNDGTVEILRGYAQKYPNIIKPIYEVENQWSKPGNPLRKIIGDAVDATEAKYVTICEGDDYWTDPYKLQKQVDFLEAHPEYDMVCTRFQHLYQESGIIEDVDLYNDIISEQTDGLELKHEHYMYSALPHPCTVMYRRGTMEDNPILPKLKYRFDIPNYWCYMYDHRVWLMNIKTAVYRKHAGSLTDAGVNFRRKIYEAYADIYQYKPEDDVLRQLCASTFRNFGILPSAHQCKYSLKDAIRDLKIYRTYKVSIKELINISYRILKARIRVKILNPLTNANKTP